MDDVLARLATILEQNSESVGNWLRFMGIRIQSMFYKRPPECPR